MLARFALAPSTRPTRVQWLIIVAHLTLALLYGALNPPWEAHDETGHFAYVNFVVQNHALPDAINGEKVLFDQSHQPPAYYALAAVLTGWLRRDDGVKPLFNRFALDGTNRRGARIMLRQTGEVFPWQGTFLALHAARVVSAALTTLTLILIALSANLMFGRASRAAILALSFAAFNPQVIFMGAMVNNDAMVSLTGAAVGYFLLALNHHTRPDTTGRQTGAGDVGVIPGGHPPLRTSSNLLALALGLSVGLAFLSKNSGIALVGCVALGLAYIAWRNQWSRRALVQRGLVTCAAFALLSVPFTIYNITRYHRLLVDRNVNNPLLNNPTSVIGASVNQAITDGWIPQLFANAFNTFWGKFGWGNVGLPDTAYWLLAGVCLIGLVSGALGWKGATREVRSALASLVILALSMMALPLYRAIYFQDPALLPGRYLMPALLGYTGLLGFGWGRLRAPSATSPAAGATNATLGRISLPTVLSSLLFLFALITPFAFILPRYAPTTIAPTSAPALLRFGDVADVIDVQAHTVNLPDREGMRHYARVQLTWRAHAPTQTQWVFGVDVLGQDNEVLGSITVYPNKGNYPSSNWRAGDTFVDEYDILLEKPCARLPALGRVNIKVFQFAAASDTGAMTITQQLPALDAAGRPTSPMIGRFKVDEGPLIPVWWQEPIAKFNQSIWLRDVIQPTTAKPGQVITMMLTYEMVHPDDKAGTVFVHLLDHSGQPLAQDDHVPQNGAYPTDLWDRGECVREPFMLTIPEHALGPVHVVTGIYDAQLVRFVATVNKDGNDTRLPDDLLKLGDIELSP